MHTLNQEALFVPTPDIQHSDRECPRALNDRHGGRGQNSLPNEQILSYRDLALIVLAFEKSDIGV